MSVLFDKTWFGTPKRSLGLDRYYSYSFTNVADFIRLSGSPLVIPATGSYSCWIEPLASLAGAGENHVMVDERDDGPSWLWGISIFDGSWYAGWNQVGVTDYRVVTATGVPTTTTRFNLVLTWDDVANETKLYKDNVQIGATSTSLVTVDFSTLATARKRFGQYNELSNGNAGNFKKSRSAQWSRVLTAGERAQLQTNCAADIPGATNIWDLLQNANDTVGSENGTVVGATLNSGDGPTLQCGRRFLLVRR